MQIVTNGQYIGLAADNDNIPAAARLPDIIALTGAAGAGKSTVAKHLVERHGYVVVKFAAGLKNMMRAIGLTEREIEGDLKEVPCKLLCDRTPRHAMQTIGTEWGRDLIGPDLWTNIWGDTVSDVLDQGGRVVTDDCRFANEEAKVRQFHGLICEVRGRGGIAGGHSSETYRPVPDVVLDNSGMVSALHGQIDAVLAAQMKVAA